MWASAVFRCWLVGVGGLLLGSCAAGCAGDGRDVMLREEPVSVQEASLILAGKSPVLDVPQALIQASPDHASSGWLGLLIYQVIRLLSRHSQRFPLDFRPRTQCSVLSVEVSPVTCKNGSDF